MFTVDVKQQCNNNNNTGHMKTDPQFYPVAPRKAKIVPNKQLVSFAEKIRGDFAVQRLLSFFGKKENTCICTVVLCLEEYSMLKIRRGKRDNLEIIFHITPLKHML